MNFVISHETLPILPPNCTKFVCFFVTTKKLSIHVDNPSFSDVLRKTLNSKSIREKVMENQEITMGKVMGKYLVKSVGTLTYPQDIEVG